MDGWIIKRNIENVIQILRYCAPPLYKPMLHPWAQSYILTATKHIVMTFNKQID